jgi:peptide-methionine (S)-S-oxide reductase
MLTRRKIVLWLLGVIPGLMLNAQSTNNAMELGKYSTATFGGGCFWCTEAVFEVIEGVVDVVSGYSGGSVKNPAYREVVTGRTGHAEVVRLTYDPGIISYTELLEIFFKTHDPTTLNRQGADVGTQYRSVIFYHDSEQREAAESYIARLDLSGVYRGNVVTELVPFAPFYLAEEYHQDYFRKNPTQAYCSYVIRPKMDKLHDDFGARIKVRKGG